MSTRTPSLGTLVATPVLACAVGLTACTGGDPQVTQAPTGPATITRPAGPTTMSVEDLVSQLLTSGTRLPAVASAQGSVRRVFNTTLPKVALTAEILEVRADSKTTLLRWRLRSTDGDTVESGGNWAAAARGINSSSTAQVAVLDHPANQRRVPYLSDTGATTTNCACSNVPGQVTGEGTDLYASLPALGATTDKVDVVIPNFPVIKDVPVTRG